MRDIDISKKVEIFFKSKEMIIAIVILFLGIIINSMVVNPMSYKPLGSNVVKKTSDGIVLSVKKIGETNYKEVVIEYKIEKGGSKITEVINIKTERNVRIGELISFDYSALNKNWAKIKGDTWDSNVVISWALLTVGVLFLVPAVREKWMEIKLFEKGQVVIGNLMLKEKAEKGKYNLEYEFVINGDSKKETIREKIKMTVNTEEEIKKSIRILYSEEDIKNRIIVKETYGVELHKI